MPVKAAEIISEAKAEQCRRETTTGLRRSFSIDRSKMDDAKRTVSLSFSSEQPVSRYFYVKGRGFLRGQEVLVHTAEACDLSMLRDGAPLLLGHDTDNPDAQVGVIDSAEVDAKEKKGRAEVRFSDQGRAPAIYADVKSGIRTKVSVGYSVDDFEVDESECEDPNDPDCEDRVFNCTRWTPYEVSLVGIPADRTVGVGRQQPPSQRVSTKEKTVFKSNVLLKGDADGGGGTASPEIEGAEEKAPTRVAVVAQASKTEKSEKERIIEILAIAGKFDRQEDGRNAILQDMSAEAFRKLVMDGLTTTPTVNLTAEEAAAVRGGAMSSVGELATNSKRYREWAKDWVQGRNFAMEFEDRLQFVRTHATTSGLTAIQKQPGVVLLQQQPLTIADVLAPGETNSQTIRYISETTFTNAAAAVAEDGAIPEAAFVLGEVDANVRKIAVIGKISNEMNEDFPAVRSYIDNRLSFMVAAKEDSELLNGDATGARIKGILNFAGISTVAAGTDLPQDAIHKALTKVRSTPGFFGMSVDAVVLHPTDWQNFKLTKDKAGQYLWGGPNSGPYGVGDYTVPGFIWGKPVIETTAIAQGTALVGAFRIGGQLFRRRGLTIEMTNSDQDDFANDRVTVRASERLALAVYRPLAFCTVTGITNP